MDFDVTKIGDALGEGIQELGDTIEEKTASFHENFVSKVVPNDGKYGEAATFAAEMFIPGVSEYNAIREGDWQRLATEIAIGAAVTVGIATIGVGVTAAASAGIVGAVGIKAVSEVAEVAVKAVAKEGGQIVAKAAVREGTEQLVKQGSEMLAKEGAEAVGEKAIKEGGEMLAKSTIKESGETITTQVTKETSEVVGKYSDEIVKAAEVKPAQLKIFEVENLEEGVVNGKRVLKQADLDLSKPEQMERIKKGLAPLGKDGKPIELHHIGQKNDSPLAEIDASVHKRNFKDLHKVDGTPSQIDRNAFRKEKKEHWQSRAAESRGEI